MRRSLLMSSLIVFGISGSVGETPPQYPTTAEAVHELIERSLTPGDSVEAVEKFLKDNGLAINYSPWDNWYSATIHDVGPWPGAKIHLQLQLDAEKRYVGPKVWFLYY